MPTSKKKSSPKKIKDTPPAERYAGVIAEDFDSKFGLILENMATIENRSTHRLEAFQSVMMKEMAKVDMRFMAVDKRFDVIDKKFDAIDKRFDKVDSEIKQVRTELTEKIESVETRLTDKINHVEIKLTEKIESVETRLAEKIDSITQRIEPLEEDVKYLKSGASLV